MDTVSSSHFRTFYSHLHRPTAVTVNGHVIGVWTPVAWAAGAPRVTGVGEPSDESRAVAAIAPMTRGGGFVVPQNAIDPITEAIRDDARAAQEFRDAILRRVNRAK